MRTGRPAPPALRVRSRLAAAAAAVLALTLVLAVAASAQPTYTLDTDPIRLGNKALEAGNLDEARAHFEEAVTQDYQVPKALLGLGTLAFREGDYKQAEGYFRQAIFARQGDSHTGSFPEARAGLGLALLRQGKTDPAAHEFDQALRAKDDLWEAVYGKARVLMLKKQWDPAAKLLEQGEEKRGLTEGEDLYHYGMALYHLGTGDLDGAEREAMIAESLAPAEPEYGLLLARVYTEQGVPAMAIQAYKRMLDAPGAAPTPELWAALGRLYRGNNQPNQARDALLQAVSLDSTYAPAYAALADLYRAAGQCDRAAPFYLSYLDRQPGDVDALVALSGCALELGAVDRAVDAARKAVALDSTRADARAALARAGLRSRDPEVQAEAAAVLAALPDSAFQDPRDLVTAAVYRSNIQDYAGAEADLRRALDRDSTLADGWYHLGLVDMGAGRPDSASAHLARAAALEPGNAAYVLNQGVAEMQAGNYTGAVGPLRKAVSLQDSLVVARVLLGQALLLSDSLAAAEKEYGEVLALEPGNAKALRGLGFCAIRRADYKEAARYYGQAAKAEPDNADGWAGLGNAQLGLGNLDQAEAAFRKARAIDPGNPTLVKGWELLQAARKEQGGG